MPKTLQDYEVDEIVTLLEELRNRCAEDGSGLLDEIDSVLDLLEEGKDTDE